MISRIRHNNNMQTINNNIIWHTIIIYVHHNTGEVIPNILIKEEKYKVIHTYKEVDIINKHNKQYGYIKKTCQVKETNTGTQLRFDF